MTSAALAGYDLGDPAAAPRRRVTVEELRAHRSEI